MGDIQTWDWKSNLRRYFNATIAKINSHIAPALGSAIIWTGIWLTSFFILYVAIHFLNAGDALPEGTPKISTTTSALVMTITLLSSHATKYISYWLGTDTDFKKEGPWTLQNLNGWRITCSSLLFGVIIAWTLTYRGKSLFTESFNPIHLEEFFGHSWDARVIIAAFFLLQIVFSWPDVKSTPVNEGRSLLGT